MKMIYSDTDDGMTDAFMDDEVDDDNEDDVVDGDNSSNRNDSEGDGSDNGFSGSEVMDFEDDITANTTWVKTVSLQIRLNIESSDSVTRSSAGGRTVRRSNRVRRPNSRYDSRTFVLAQTLIQCMMIATVWDLLYPTSVQEALSSEHAAQWKRAMDVEYESLIGNQTLVLVPRPKPTRDKHVIYYHHDGC
ncbi:unnamed protein product [Phytophthora fragariaefolia]|uniref:Unnamed protein product n=1 Tax=Phytophthora fragariaefolia TaxID=1490495 RepID=A0A9W6TMB2_9STRA|nr:unnamed protein product [Phytophthora fragariaefolia]